ncbi:hypothetical protein ACMT4L_18095 [Deinococcus sp. A31D244]|uniref:hypothetical protein n=1 Tax=Deinococcus sp. A31D244 TaxID=3397675 RepID=UPI0039E1F8A5
MSPPDATGKRGRAEAVLNAFSAPGRPTAQINLFAELDDEKMKLSGTELSGTEPPNSIQFMTFN